MPEAREADPQAALERAMTALAFEPEFDDAGADAIAALLQRSGVSVSDAQAMVAGGADRLLVYRRLVRGNLWEAMRVSIPRVMARMGDVFEEYFSRFLAQRGPRTHYLRDATPELLDFCEPLWAADPRVPAYMMQLARHEFVQIEVGACQTRPLDEEPAGLDLNAPVRFIEAARLMRYDWALHLLSESDEDRTEPVERPTALFVHRNPEHEVRYLELTPMAADILERLMAGKPLGEAVTQAAALHGRVLDQAVLDGTAKLLADLAERGALLGKGRE